MTRRELLGLLRVSAPELGGRGCVIREGRTVQTWWAKAERRDVLSSAKPGYGRLEAPGVRLGNALGVEDGLAFRPSNRRLSAPARDFGKWKGRRILSERLFGLYRRPRTDAYLKIGTYGGGAPRDTFIPVLVAMGANRGKLEPGNADSLTNQHIVKLVRS